MVNKSGLTEEQAIFFDFLDSMSLKEFVDNLKKNGFDLRFVARLKESGTKNNTFSQILQELVYLVPMSGRWNKPKIFISEPDVNSFYNAVKIIKKKITSEIATYQEDGVEKSLRFYFEDAEIKSEIKTIRSLK